jgi:hypothetical protein
VVGPSSAAFRDDDDAPAVAIGAAVAAALELEFMVVHVVAPVTMITAAAMAMPVVSGFTVEDRASARETLDRVVAAAGLHCAQAPERRILRGAPGTQRLSGSHARSRRHSSW